MMVRSDECYGQSDSKEKAVHSSALSTSSQPPSLLRSQPKCTRKYLFSEATLTGLILTLVSQWISPLLRPLGDMLRVLQEWFAAAYDDGTCPANDTSPDDTRPKLDSVHDLITLADTLAAQYADTVDLDLMGQPIVFWREVLEMVGPCDPRYTPTRARLACALRARFPWSNSHADIEEAITIERANLEACRCGQCLHALALSLLARYCLLGAKDDLQETITLERLALTFTPGDDSTWGHRESVHALASALWKRFEVVGELDVLDESIALFHAAAALPAQRVQDTAQTLCGLLVALRTRFMQLGAAADLDDAVRLAQEALQLSIDARADRAQALNVLGKTLWVRFQYGGTAQDLAEAIALQREALAIRAPGHPERALSLDDTAIALRTRFSLLGTAEDLEESIELNRAALALRKPGHPDRSMTLNSLANGLYARREHFGAREDLAEAIRLHREALGLRLGDHASRSQSLGNLANVLLSNFNFFGAKADLDEAIELHRETLQRSKPGRPYYAHALSNLAHALWICADFFNAPDALGEAIGLHRTALQLHGTNPDAAFSLNNLALTLVTRFELRGDIADLDEAVRMHRGALLVRQEGNPDRAQSLANLAYALHARFAQFGVVEDMEEAVALFRAALERRADGHPDVARLLDHLADVLMVRFKRGTAPADLGEALALLERSLSLREPGTPYRAKSLDSLAGALHIRFEQQGEMADIERAVTLNQEALGLRPDGHPHRDESLLALALDYKARFGATKDEGDLHRSAELMRSVLDILPSDHARRFKCLFALADLFLTPSPTFYNSTTALKFFLMSPADCQTNALLRLKASVKVLGKFSKPDALDLESRPLLLEAYVRTVRLLPRVAFFGLNSRSRLEALHEGESIALEAAAYALSLAQPNIAIEILEEGRAMFWTQALRLRTQFDEVPGHLRAELVRLSNLLELGSHEPGDSRSHGAPGPAHEVRRHRQTEDEATTRRLQSQEFERLIDEVRKTPGFERFMLHNDFGSLRKVSEKGVVVVLIASRASCDAIILDVTGEATRIQFPSITVASLQKLSEWLKDSHESTRQAESKDRGCRIIPGKTAGMVLAQLWDQIGKPIMDALKLKPSSGRQRPRIWWCPTGQFAFLPIHASGRYLSCGDCMSDYIVSSYTPTLGALLTARRFSTPPTRSSAKLLLAAVPKTYLQSSLPYAAEEVEAVKSVAPSNMLLPLPAEDDTGVDRIAGATVQTVIDRLPQATILHLASHGVQDTKSPLDSGFIMRDGVLSISKLMPIPLPKAFFAFLSACETAKGDRTQPDQTVHLAATMLFIGYKSVVATMWSMSDIDGPVVARTVYEQLFAAPSDVLDPDVVPYALDDAVRSLRENRLHPSRWALYVHIGM